MSTKPLTAADLLGIAATLPFDVVAVQEPDPNAEGISLEPVAEEEKEKSPPTTADRKAEFLRLIAAGHKVRSACRGVGIGWRTPYEWKDSDAAFAEKWKQAKIVRFEQLVEEARRRALAGSDRMLMFMMTNESNGLYAMRDKVEITGNVDVAVAIVEARKRLRKENAE